MRRQTRQTSLFFYKAPKGPFQLKQGVLDDQQLLFLQILGSHLGVVKAWFRILEHFNGVVNVFQGKGDVLSADGEIGRLFTQFWTL